MVIGVEMVTVGEGIDVFSKKSSVIGTETGIEKITSGFVETGCETSGYEVAAVSSF